MDPDEFWYVFWDFPSSVVDSCIKLMEHGDSQSIWKDFPDPFPYLPIPGGSLIYLGNQVTEKMPGVPVKEDRNLTWTLKSSHLNLCYGNKDGTAFILLHCYIDRGCIALLRGLPVGCCKLPCNILLQVVEIWLCLAYMDEICWGDWCRDLFIYLFCNITLNTFQLVSSPQNRWEALQFEPYYSWFLSCPPGCFRKLYRHLLW